MSNNDESRKITGNAAADADKTAKPYPTKEPAEETEKSSAAVSSDDDVEEIIITPEEEKVDNVIKLSKKYKFEGKIIEEIDLSGIENVSGETAQRIAELYRKNTKNVSATPEFTPEYAMATASIITGLPVEFFKHINFKDITKMKNRIVNFLYGD